MYHLSVGAFAAARRRGRELSRVPRLASGVSDRLEPRAQAAARARVEECRTPAADVGSGTRPRPYGVSQGGWRAADLRRARFRRQGPGPVRRAAGQILGAEEAATTSSRAADLCRGVARGEPESFVQDAVRAELFNYFRTDQQLLYDIAAEHAALIVEIAAASATACCRCARPMRHRASAQREAGQGVGAARRRAGESRPSAAKHAGPKRSAPSWKRPTTSRMSSRTPRSSLRCSLPREAHPARADTPPARRAARAAAQGIRKADRDRAPRAPGRRARGHAGLSRGRRTASCNGAPHRRGAARRRSRARRRRRGLRTLTC